MAEGNSQGCLEELGKQQIPGLGTECAVSHGMGVLGSAEREESSLSLCPEPRASQKSQFRAVPGEERKGLAAFIF